MHMESDMRIKEQRNIPLKKAKPISTCDKKSQAKAVECMEV